MEHLFPRFRARIELLAEKLGINIPYGLPVQFWMLPILEELVNRIEKLEEKKGGDNV